MALIETGITYKRKPTSKTVISKDLSGWSKADVEHYGKSMIEVLPSDVEVWCYHRGQISVILKNGGIV